MNDKRTYAEVIEAFRMLQGNLRDAEQSWRNIPEAPSQISTPVMVALAEVANALSRTCTALIQLQTHED